MVESMYIFIARGVHKLPNYNSQQRFKKPHILCA